MKKCNGTNCRCNPHLEFVELRKIYFLGINLVDVKVYRPAPSTSQAVKASIDFGTVSKK